MQFVNVVGAGDIDRGRGKDETEKHEKGVEEGEGFRAGHEVWKDQRSSSDKSLICYHARWAYEV